MLDECLQRYLNKLDRGEKLNECQIGDMREDGKIIKEIIRKQTSNYQEITTVVEINNRYFLINWKQFDEDAEFDDYPYQPKEIAIDKIEKI